MYQIQRILFLQCECISIGLDMYPETEDSDAEETSTEGQQSGFGVSVQMNEGLEIKTSWAFGRLTVVDLPLSSLLGLTGRRSVHGREFNPCDRSQEQHCSLKSPQTRLETHRYSFSCVRVREEDLPDAEDSTTTSRSWSVQWWRSHSANCPEMTYFSIIIIQVLQLRHIPNQLFYFIFSVFI